MTDKKGIVKKFTEKVKNILAPIASTRTSYDSQSLLDGYETNPFIRRKGFRTADKMLADDQIFSILEMKKNSILSTGWTIETPGDVDDTNLETIKEFVEYNFSEAYSRNLNIDLYNILTAQEYGFSLSEMLFERGDQPDFKNMIWLKRLRTVPPHSIDFYTDDKGELDRIVQRGVTGGTIDLPIWKFLLFVKSERFDNFYGKPELERCYQPWFIKDKINKLWGIYLQRFASTFPVAKVPNDFGENNTNNLLNILESIQQASAAVVPETVDIEYLTANNSSAEYEKAIEKFNQAIARALLIPDLLGFGQTVRGGSLALGKKHFEIFLNMLKQERLLLEDLINDRAVKLLVDVNYGKQDVYPKFKFLPYEDEDLDKMLNLFLETIKLGMPVTLPDLNHFREKIKFPILEEDYEPLERVMPTNDTKSEPGPEEGKEKKSAPKKEEKEETKGDETDDEEKVKDSFAKDKDLESKESDFKPKRKPSKYEARIPFVKEDQIIKQKEDILIKNLAVLFTNTRNSLKEVIQRREIIPGNRFTEINRLQLKNLGKIKEQFGKGYKDIYNFGWKEAQLEIKKLKEDQAPQIKELQDAQKLEEFILSSPNDLLVPSKEAQKVANDIIDETTFQSVGTLKDGLLNESKQVLLSGMQNGESVNGIMNNLDKVFNGVTSGAEYAGLSVQPWQLETIVRTNYTNFYNLARKQVANTPALKGFIKMYEFSAIIDGRTSERCAELDGKKYKVNDPIWSNITPPMHFNCRSKIRYITIVDVQEDKLEPDKPISLKKIKDMPGGDGFV